MKISVIMPAYNEAGFIAAAIKETIDTFETLNVDFEIIIVDDGSSDGTFDRAEEFTKNFKNIIVTKNYRNRGKGYALKRGFKHTTGDLVVFLDADIDIHPIQIKTFLNIMELDHADIVIGSKRHPNSELEYPLQRRIVSSVYFFIIKILFGLPIHDTQTGLKLFKYEVLKKVFPVILVKRFAYDLEILLCAHLLGYKIAEAPVILKPKMKFNPVGFSAIYTTWLDTMAVWYRAFILKYYDRFNNNTSKKA